MRLIIQNRYDNAVGGFPISFYHDIRGKAREGGGVYKFTEHIIVILQETSASSTGKEVMMSR